MTTKEKIEKIKQCGMSYTVLMGRLNLSKFCFVSRMTGKIEFRESEINEVDRILKIVENI